MRMGRPRGVCGVVTDVARPRAVGSKAVCYEQSGESPVFEERRKGSEKTGLGPVGMKGSRVALSPSGMCLLGRESHGVSWISRALPPLLPVGLTFVS